jgi:glucose-6-phosphate dehydrogenase assembly protein OpcA
MDTSGEGMHAVRLVTSRGEVSLVRTSPNQALYVVPNQPQRQVALARRGVIDLLSEELRRLDQDIILHEVLDDLAASEVKEATGASR